MFGVYLTTIKAKTNSYYYELLNMWIFIGKMENMSTPSTTSHITTIFNKIEIYLSSNLHIFGDIWYTNLFNQIVYFHIFQKNHTWKCITDKITLQPKKSKIFPVGIISQLNYNNPQLQHLALLFFALQFFTQARMNPSTVGKGGCMAGRFSRSTMGSSSTSLSSPEELPLRLRQPEWREKP